VEGLKAISAVLKSAAGQVKKTRREKRKEVSGMAKDVEAPEGHRAKNKKTDGGLGGAQMRTGAIEDGKVRTPRETNCFKGTTKRNRESPYSGQMAQLNEGGSLEAPIGKVGTTLQRWLE